MISAALGLGDRLFSKTLGLTTHQSFSFISCNLYLIYITSASSEIPDFSLDFTSFISTRSLLELLCFPVVSLLQGNGY